MRKDMKTPVVSAAPNNAPKEKTSSILRSVLGRDDGTNAGDVAFGRETGRLSFSGLGAFSLSRRPVIIGAAILTTVPIPRAGLVLRSVETGSINRRSTTTLALAKYRFQRCCSVGDAWDRIAKAKSSTVGYRRSCL